MAADYLYFGMFLGISLSIVVALGMSAYHDGVQWALLRDCLTGVVGSDVHSEGKDLIWYVDGDGFKRYVTAEVVRDCRLVVLDGS